MWIILLIVGVILALVAWCLCAMSGSISRDEERKEQEELKHKMSDLSEYEKQVVKEVLEYHNNKVNGENIKPEEN